jgi:predicted SAM-dependent methyltransferase
VKTIFRKFLSGRTRKSLRFDELRFYARIKHQSKTGITPSQIRLHFGCGNRRIAGWLNVDVVDSEFDVDLSSPLPWENEVFDCVVSQHVIQHLEIDAEIPRLFQELARVCRSRAEFWLSCPDMEKICRAYCEDGGRHLLALSRERGAVWPAGLPSSHMINVLFHQGNEHKNLFDFTLLKWLLENAGFGLVEKMDEAAFLRRFPEFPANSDDDHTLYVRSICC